MVVVVVVDRKVAVQLHEWIATFEYEVYVGEAIVTRGSAGGAIQAVWTSWRQLLLLRRGLSRGSIRLVRAAIVVAQLTR